MTNDVYSCCLRAEFPKCAIAGQSYVNTVCVFIITAVHVVVYSTENVK